MARSQLIEDIGFDGIWFGETIGRMTSARPDPLVWLSMAAAGTQRNALSSALGAVDWASAFSYAP